MKRNKRTSARAASGSGRSGESLIFLPRGRDLFVEKIEIPEQSRKGGDKTVGADEKDFTANGSDLSTQSSTVDPKRYSFLETQWSRENWSHQRGIFPDYFDSGARVVRNVNKNRKFGSRARIIETVLAERKGSESSHDGGEDLNKLYYQIRTRSAGALHP